MPSTQKAWPGAAPELLSRRRSGAQLGGRGRWRARGFILEPPSPGHTLFSFWRKRPLERRGSLLVERMQRKGSRSSAEDPGGLRSPPIPHGAGGDVRTHRVRSAGEQQQRRQAEAHGAPCAPSAPGRPPARSHSQFWGLASPAGARTRAGRCALKSHDWGTPPHPRTALPPTRRPHALCRRAGLISTRDAAGAPPPSWDWLGAGAEAGGGAGREGSGGELVPAGLAVGGGDRERARGLGLAAATPPRTERARS